MILRTENERVLEESWIEFKTPRCRLRIEQ